MSATTVLTIDQLIATASDIRIDSMSERTRQVYKNHVEHFAAFLHTARGIEDEILPWNPMYVEAWITELSQKTVASMHQFARKSWLCEVTRENKACMT